MILASSFKRMAAATTRSWTGNNHLQWHFALPFLGSGTVTDWTWHVKWGHSFPTRASKPASCKKPRTCEDYPTPFSPRHLFCPSHWDAELQGPVSWQSARSHVVRQGASGNGALDPDSLKPQRIVVDVRAPALLHLGPDQGKVGNVTVGCGWPRMTDKCSPLVEQSRTNPVVKALNMGRIDEG